MLLLTPLVLTRWEKPEIASFYLVASVVGFTTLLTGFLPRIVNPVLVFFYSGIKTLKDVGKEELKGEEPNWAGFSDAYATLRNFQWKISAGLVLMAAGSITYALSRQLGWIEFRETHLWIPVILGVQVVFQVLVSGIAGCVKAVGQIAIINRNAALFSFLQILGASLAIVFGGNLEAVLLVQLGIASVHRLVLFRILRQQVPELRRGVFQREIFDNIKRPLKRGFIGLISSVGLQRLSPLLVAGVLSDENLVIYALCLSLVASISAASNAFVSSQLPRIGKYFAQGQRPPLRELSINRMVLSLAMFVILGPAVFIALAWIIHFSDSAVSPPPVLFSVVFLSLFAARLFVNNFATIYNVTNERPFYVRNLTAAMVTLTVLFYLGQSSSDSIWLPLFAITIPHLLILELFPLRKFSELAEIKPREIPANFLKNAQLMAAGISGKFAKAK